jgi:hypothetical protein
MPDPSPAFPDRAMKYNTDPLFHHGFEQDPRLGFPLLGVGRKLNFEAKAQGP